MKILADRCLYCFWAETKEEISLYRLYCPTETLDLIYTISKEEFEEKYFYTPQTEAAADWLSCEVGERVCLLGSVAPYSNEEFLWYTYNKEFLERYDEVMSHPEDYPQYFEEGPMGDWFDIVPWLETGDCCNMTAHYVDAVSGRHDSRPEGVYKTYGYWWEADDAVVTPTPTAEPTPDPGPQIYTFAEFGAPVNGTGRFPLDESSSAQIAALVDLSPETVAGWTTVETWDRLYLVELTLADGRVACLEREQERTLLRLNGQIYDCTESVDFDQLCRTLEAARLAAVRADLPQLTRLSIDVWDVPSFNREISLDAEASQFIWDTLLPDDWEIPDMYTEHDLARGWKDFVDLYCGDRLIARVTEGEIIGLEKSYTVIFYQIDGEKDQSAYIFAPEEAYKTLWNWAQGFSGELEPTESSAPVPLETPAADDTRYFFADGYFLGSWSDGTWCSCSEGENNFTVGEIFNRDYYDVFGDQFHSVRFYVGMADNNPRGGFEGTEFLEPFGIIEGDEFIMKLPGQLTGEAAQVAAPYYNFRASFDGATELISSNVALEGPSHRYAENLLPEETLTQVLADAGIRCDLARTDRFAWELDMDSDGAEEYLELVRTHRDEDGYMNFGPGEQCFYAIILQDGDQVSVVTSKAISYTTDLTAQFYASDVQCRDLDGDGICEVIFNVTAWEGGGYQALTFADGQWTCVLRSNYGT